MHCFDLTANKWLEVGSEIFDSFSFGQSSCYHVQLPALPFARSVFGAVADQKGRIIAFGGEVDPSSAGHEGAGDFCSDLTCLVRRKATCDRSACRSLVS